MAKMHEVTWNGETIAEMQEYFIRSALIVNKGNLAKTATMLKISRAQLYRRLKKYGLLKNRHKIGGDRSRLKE